jgi:hypothetical protein
MNFTQVAIGILTTAVGVALGVYAEKKFLNK